MSDGTKVSVRTRTTRGGHTEHSDTVPGDSGNFGRAVRFDLTGAYVGISEYLDPSDNGGPDRVLLSPRQVRALLDFLRPRTGGRSDPLS